MHAPFSSVPHTHRPRAPLERAAAFPFSLLRCRAHAWRAGCGGNACGTEERVLEASARAKAVTDNASTQQRLEAVQFELASASTR
jgi:hypothetical protein